MGSWHAIMKDWHPMVGVDFHIPWPPGSPSPTPPPAPYKTFAIMHGTGITCVYCPTHHSAGVGGFTMARGSDIGPLIPHVGVPSQTMMLEMAFSASKCHFGPRAYAMSDNRGGQSPIAAALLMMVNPNLNCGIPAPTPTGFVLAFNTHGVGMTMGDIEAGFWQMTVDIVVQTALFFIGGAVFGRIGSLLSRRLAPRVMSRNAAKLFLRNRGVKSRDINAAQRALRRQQGSRSANYGSRVAPRIEQSVDTVGNIATGGPLGVDADTVADGSTAVSRATDFGNELAGTSDNPVNLGNAGDAIYDYLNRPDMYPDTSDSSNPADADSDGPADAGPPPAGVSGGGSGDGPDGGVPSDDGGLSDGDI